MGPGVQQKASYGYGYELDDFLSDDYLPKSKEEPGKRYKSSESLTDYEGYSGFAIIGAGIEVLANFLFPPIEPDFDSDSELD